MGGFFVVKNMAQVPMSSNKNQYASLEDPRTLAARQRNVSYGYSPNANVSYENPQVIQKRQQTLNPQVLSYQTGPTSGVGRSTAPTDPSAGMIQDQRSIYDTQLSNIQGEFERSFGRLDDLERQTNDFYNPQFAQAEQDLNQTYGVIEGQRANRMTELGQQEQQTREQGRQSLSQVRQAVSDAQRRGAAYQSAVGTSSSLGDAMNESISRTGVQGVTQVQDQISKNLATLSTKRTDVNQFYDDQRIQTKKSYDSQVNQLRAQFMGALDNIKSARFATESERRASVQDAYANFVNATQAIKQWQQNRQDALDQWRSQATASLNAYETAAKQYSVGGVDSVIAPNMQFGMPNQTPTQSQPQANAYYYKSPSRNPDDELLNQSPLAQVRSMFAS